MRSLLACLFAGILLAMLAMTTVASLDRSVFNVGREMLADPWFQVTLADAYFGFLTFYAWVAYKERTIAMRIAWFVLIMCLGNIAMSVYVLMQLAKLRPGDGWEALLLRRPAAT